MSWFSFFPSHSQVFSLLFSVFVYLSLCFFPKKVNVNYVLTYWRGNIWEATYCEMEMHFTCRKKKFKNMQKVSVWLWPKSPFNASSLSCNITAFNCIGFGWFGYVCVLWIDCNIIAVTRHKFATRSNKIVKNNGHTTNLAEVNEV